MKWHTLLTIVLLLIVIGISGCSDKKRKRSKRGKRAKASTKWLKGGTLLNKTPGQWRKASRSNKLATCGNVVVKMWKNKKFVPGIQNDIKSVNGCREFALQLVAHLDIQTNPQANRKLKPNQTISSMIPHAVMMLGWTR